MKCSRKMLVVLWSPDLLLALSRSLSVHTCGCVKRHISGGGNL